MTRLDLQRLSQEGERSRAKRTESQELVETKEQARLEQEQALAEARTTLEDLQQESVSIGEEHSALRVELAGLEERRRSECALIA